jgi:hypothetical protein
MEPAKHRPSLIVMLTHQDETVPDSLQIFERLKDLPVQHWGFKDVGLPPAEMGRVAAAMRVAGKTTYLEVISLSEQAGLRGARLAVEQGFDVLMGTVYFPSIRAYLAGTPVQYYPFPGRVQGHPSVLEGTIEEIVEHARWLEAQGVEGLDLLTYRFTGNAPRLLQQVVSAVSIPVVSAGSIASYDRIQEVADAGAWGFTIGSAFFDGRFVPGAGFDENLRVVTDWLQTA